MLQFETDTTEHEPLDQKHHDDGSEAGVTLQRPHERDASRTEHRLVVMSDESAVEVSADKMNLSVHGGNSDIDFTGATSNGFDDEVRLRVGNGTAAKKLAQPGIDRRAEGGVGGD